ncbi:MAG: hypothetical protein L6V93_10370 [Clostridiales bacterium]|nr:MAG: hypothetical protein L6V93_10370 [Clostridiales bacterium]
MEAKLKKLLCGILTACMIMSLIPLSAFASTEVTAIDLTLTKTEKSARRWATISAAI